MCELSGSPLALSPQRSRANGQKDIAVTIAIVVSSKTSLGRSTMVLGAGVVYSMP